MIASIQGLRAIAALLVLLFHIGIVDRKYGDGSMFPNALRFGDAGVDLFFVVSGFIIGSLLKNEPRSLPRAVNFFARRMLRIIPPYWLYTTLVVVALYVFPGEVNRSYEGQSIVKSYLLIPQDTLPILTVGWTLVHEAYFYLVMCVLIASATYRTIPAYLAAWSLLCGAVGFIVEPTDPVGRLISHPMTLEFTAGVAISLLVRFFPRSMAPVVAWIGALGLATGMGWLAESGASVTPTHYRVIVFGSSGALLILGLVRWEAEFGSPFPSAINAIGDTSFSLYLSHVFVISSFAMAWSAAGLFQNEYGHAAYIAFAVVLSILVGIVSHRLIERPLLRLSRRVLRADDRGAPTSPVPNLVTPLR